MSRCLTYLSREDGVLRDGDGAELPKLNVGLMQEVLDWTIKSSESTERLPTEHRQSSWMGFEFIWDQNKPVEELTIQDVNVCGSFACFCGRAVEVACGYHPKDLISQDSCQNKLSGVLVNLRLSRGDERWLEYTREQVYSMDNPLPPAQINTWNHGVKSRSEVVKQHFGFTDGLGEMMSQDLESCWRAAGAAVLGITDYEARMLFHGDNGLHQIVDTCLDIAESRGEVLEIPEHLQ